MILIKLETIWDKSHALYPLANRLNWDYLVIEPIIEHLNNDHRLGRNYLLGKTGDHVNAISAGCAFNLKKIIRSFKLKHACFA